MPMSAANRILKITPGMHPFWVKTNYEAECTVITVH